MVMRKLALFVDGIRIESALAIAFIISVAWLGAVTFVLLVPMPSVHTQPGPGPSSEVRHR
jgi:hypothetical protein